VLRGDANVIRIGHGSNLQDGTMVHVTRNGQPTILGEDVTVGHATRLHGCTIASNCLIGIGAIVLDGVEIAEESLVAAGSRAAPGTKIPSRGMVMGAPARVRREVAADLELIHNSARNHVALKNDYLAAARARG
jgi:carbonic anhydrase/acetyltransferase-like protein (isoleucine patch superfamily)